MQTTKRRFIWTITGRWQRRFDVYDADTLERIRWVGGWKTSDHAMAAAIQCIGRLNELQADEVDIVTWQPRKGYSSLFAATPTHWPYGKFQYRVEQGDDTSWHVNIFQADINPRRYTTDRNDPLIILGGYTSHADAMQAVEEWQACNEKAKRLLPINARALDNEKKVVRSFHDDFTEAILEDEEWDPADMELYGGDLDDF